MPVVPTWLLYAQFHTEAGTKGLSIYQPKSIAAHTLYLHGVEADQGEATLVSRQPLI